ncbi:MAG: arginine--tRNA ligase, partial [Candidatus Schekmanbacteria bacterium]
MKRRIEKSLKEALNKVVKDASIDKMPPIVIERPKNEQHGDFATNAAMALAGILKRKPRDIAEEIIGSFENSLVDKVEIAGPGFINFFLKDYAWQSVIADVVEKGTDFGSSDIGKGKSCNLEFVSANPTGPLHIGHGRGAAVGDVLANVLRFAGYDVCREYYINDFGNQIEKLGQSLQARYYEAIGRDISFPEGGYPGEYLKEIANELVQKFGDSLSNK